jgi:ribonuclease BN (tRNA processing enzyme)
VQLTVLGCSGSTSGPRAAASGYLVEAAGFLLGVELGHGTLAELMAMRDPDELDALLFSHLHPDHCADFTALTVVRRYHPTPLRAQRLPVYAPREAPERFVAAYSPDAAERATEDLTDVFEFHPLAEGTVQIGPFEVLAAPALHPCDAFSFRIVHDGRSLVYTGDTGTSATIERLAKSADVLLAEASWTHAPDRPPDMHMSGVEAGRLAQTADAGRLLLTHLGPWTDPDAVLAEATTEFAGPIHVVRQGETLDI